MCLSHTKPSIIPTNCRFLKTLSSAATTHLLADAIQSPQKIADHLCVCVGGGSQTVVAKWSMKKSKETRRGETKDLSHRVKTCRQTFASVCRIWRVLTWWSVRSNTPDKLNIHHSYFLFPTRLLSFQRDISVKHLLNYTTRCQWTFVGRTYETGKEQCGINRG